MSEQQPAMYALLIGIDDYLSPRIPDLGGCVADVDAMEQLLHDRLKVPPKNIKKLTNSEATYKNIKAAFKKYLIKPAQKWVAAGRPAPAPAFLFHYSGHGSQALDETGTEPDGMDETIVPHDSRVGDVYDIKDWELNGLLAELTGHFVDEDTQEYFGNVTVILDCCHSGSGTRDIQDIKEKGVLPTRRCEPDLRSQPSRRPATEARTRGAISGSGWRKKDEQYVLLAGCRDREEANEHVVREGDSYHQQGAMTYFMVEELARMSPDRPLTYRELHERVRYQVNSAYPTQMPQCEGDRDREIFGGLRPARDIFLTVVDKKEGFIWVDGGVAHGLTEGSELKVYPPKTRTLDEAGEPIATLTVKSVRAIRSGCQVSDGQENIPLHAKVAIHRLDPVGMKRRVVLDVPAGPTLTGLQTRLQAEDVKNYVEEIPVGTPADFRVQQVGDKLQLQDGTGQLLVAPFAPNDLDGLGHDLTHLVRYRNALDLTNKAADSTLAGKISLEVKKLGFDPETQKPRAEPIERTAGGELIIETGTNIVIEVTNRANIPLYFTLLEFGYQWDIVQWYPEVGGAHEPLAPGQTYHLGLSVDPGRQAAFGLPEEVPEAREILKVIATKEDADFEILTQGELKTAFQTRSANLRDVETNPLNQLLDLAMSMDEGTRGALQKKGPSIKDEWTTAQAGFLITQPATAASAKRALHGGAPTTLPGYDFQIEPPAGFTGQVRVLTERQSTRAAGDDSSDLRPPAGLAPFGNLFQPVGVKSTRAVGPAGAVIEIEADDEARQQVTEATPLKLSLPAEMADAHQPILALAYDGNFYYLAGRPGKTADILNIEWLPDTPPADEQPIRSTRNLGRTVKLYLYKMAGWSDPTVGLHKVRFVPTEHLKEDKAEEQERVYQAPNGEVRYRDMQPGEIKAGQRVALFVHGFISETPPLVGSALPLFAANNVDYDHFLAFDYETFNTRISDNGQTLTNALRAAGFGPDDGIHLDVFAHSMGTLVTRSVVELWGGEEFVDRCFLAGPPNGGTRLASARRLVPWLGTLLLNQAGPTPPTLIASWVLKKVSDDAVGGEDLRPGSEFLKQLNGSAKPAKIPYHILAGRNDLPAAEQGVWQRLVHRLQQGTDVALDFLFNDQHDLVINLLSMQTVRNGNYPQALLKTKVVPCNHFEYFSTPESQQQLLKWVRVA